MKKIMFMFLILGLSVSCSSEKKREEKRKNYLMEHEMKGMTHTRAKAKLESHVKGLSGEVEFVETKNGVTVLVKAQGIPAGVHGFHVHEYGDCSKKDYSSAGGHFNPVGSKHGIDHDPNSHLGDLGNIVAPASKVVDIKIHKNHVTFLHEGKNSILGKAVIIHEKADDYTTQPTGNAGGRIACGVIVLDEK